MYLLKPSAVQCTLEHNSYTLRCTSGRWHRIHLLVSHLILAWKTFTTKDVPHNAALLLPTPIPYCRTNHPKFPSDTQNLTQTAYSWRHQLWTHLRVLPVPAKLSRAFFFFLCFVLLHTLDSYREDNLAGHVKRTYGETSANHVEYWEAKFSTWWRSRVWSWLNPGSVLYFVFYIACQGYWTGRLVLLITSKSMLGPCASGHACKRSLGSW